MCCKLIPLWQTWALGCLWTGWWVGNLCCLPDAVKGTDYLVIFKWDLTSYLNHIDDIFLFYFIFNQTDESPSGLSKAQFLGRIFVIERWCRLVLQELYVSSCGDSLCAAEICGSTFLDCVCVSFCFVFGLWTLESLICKILIELPWLCFTVDLGVEIWPFLQTFRFL